MSHYLIIMGLASVSVCASDEETAFKVVEGAKKEGKVVLYTTMNVIDSSKMIKQFEEKYPFLKVTLYRLPSDTLQSKILTEARVKKYIPDIIEIPGFNISVIKKAGLLTSYISPENRAYPEGFKDPDGSWTSTYILAFIMAYNTKLNSRKDIPDTYEGFLNPKWKGKKIGIDVMQVEWYANMLKIMGEAKGKDFMRKFTAQELNNRRGNTLVTQLVAAGEFPAGTSFPQIAEDMKKVGASVDWVPVWPVIGKLGAIGLSAHASHPNAAKLYIDFALSKEGQAVIGSVGRLPARPDLEASKINTYYKGLKIHPSDMALADKYAVYSKEWNELLKLDRSR